MFRSILLNEVMFKPYTIKTHLGWAGIVSVRPLEQEVLQPQLTLKAETMAEKATGSFKEGDRQQLIDDGFALVVIDLNKSEASKEDYQNLSEPVLVQSEQSLIYWLAIKATIPSLTTTTPASPNDEMTWSISCSRFNKPHFVFHHHYQDGA